MLILATPTRQRDTKMIWQMKCFEGEGPGCIVGDASVQWHYFHVLLMLTLLMVSAPMVPSWRLKLMPKLSCRSFFVVNPSPHHCCVRCCWLPPPTAQVGGRERGESPLGWKVVMWTAGRRDADGWVVVMLAGGAGCVLGKADLLQVGGKTDLN